MNGRNISIASKNGYTYEKVMKAKKYIDEIGGNKRTFPFKRLVEMYNELTGQSDSPSGCSCQSPKYYNALVNYYKYGKMTLINSGGMTEEDFMEKKEEEKPREIENAEKRINLGTSEEAISEPSESVSEDKVEDIKEEEKEEPTEEKKKVGRPKKSKE